LIKSLVNKGAYQILYIRAETRKRIAGGKISIKRKNFLDMFFLKLWDNLNPLTRMLGFRSPRCIKSADEFLQIIKRERARADRYSHEFSLAFFYLENMDSSDDTLKCLSHIIARRVRYTDQVGWLDKSSLTVLLPDTSAHDARKFVHKISNAIAETDSPPTCRVYTYSFQKYRSIIKRLGSPAVVNDYVEKTLVSY